MKKRIGWLVILVAAVVLLGIGASRRPSAGSTPERIREIAATTKCPVCAGESVGQSNAPASLVIKELIAREIAAGKSDNDVRSAIVKYDANAIALTPPNTGAASLVWVLPVIALVSFAAGLVVIFRRGRV